MTSKITRLNDYHISFIARQEIPKSEEDEAERFIFELVCGEKDDDTKTVVVPSVTNFPTPEDAVQEAFGIVRLLGFDPTGDDPQKIMVLRWDTEEQTYNETFVFFDGYDFYPEDVVEQLSKEDEEDGDED